MIICPYCGQTLDYKNTKIVNEQEHKFYNLFVCTNSNCPSHQDIITDCTGNLELGHVNCCYPEELMNLYSDFS
jgi:hypothetical protein